MTPDHITPTGADPILHGECPVVVGGGALRDARRHATAVAALRELRGLDQMAAAITAAALAKGGAQYLRRLIEQMGEE